MGAMTLHSILALFLILLFQDGPDPTIATILLGKAGSGKGKGHICLHSIGRRDLMGNGCQS